MNIIVYYRFDIYILMLMKIFYFPNRLDFSFIRIYRKWCLVSSVVFLLMLWLCYSNVLACNDDQIMFWQFFFCTRYVIFVYLHVFLYTCSVFICLQAAQKPQRSLWNREFFILLVILTISLIIFQMSLTAWPGQCYLFSLKSSDNVRIGSRPVLLALYFYH